MRKLKTLSTLAITLVVSFSFLTTAFATTTYCDDGQNDSVCRAAAATTTYWTTLGPGSSYWKAGSINGYALKNTYNGTSSTHWYVWLFHLPATGYYYDVAVYVDDPNFVDVVSYKYDNTYTTTLDQNYAPGGWNQIPSLTTISNGDTPLDAIRSTYYGGMGVDAAFVVH